MTDTLSRVVAFCAGRYNALNVSNHKQANAYAAILIMCRELSLASPDPDRDILDWLSLPHSDPDQARACALVLEQLNRPQ